MLSASASPLPSPRSPSPAIEPASSSLLLTPEDKSSPRQTGGTPSDDSLLSELSFEYKKDDNGNYIRISKSKSPSLGAPGKYPKPERRSSPKTATDRSSLDALLALTERRDSDSLSESASATLAGPSQQPTASVLGVGSRPIQRTGSGSGVVSYITPLTHSTTLRSKLGASSIGRSGATRIGLGRAGRVSKEERAQQEERNRLADEELRAEAQRRLEEKENLLNGQAAEVLPAATDPEKRSSLPPQSLRASALVGASSSMSRSRSSGMGDSQRSSYPRGAGNARPVSRLRKDTFEEISEYSGSETQSADEFMLGLEAEAGETSSRLSMAQVLRKAKGRRSWVQCD
ncbi:hypothetical protein OE88DRAFT_1412007 [Heliocybe sulcata]|uniref:Uncharacterized protein n=1 Tax=Heliocybe sulcata TaxID=5364 RepID=A0A5C3N981_9AGAM|nr:hypothetical protein OE88DRAFT_1412007 [Heliocybe sulcata]